MRGIALLLASLHKPLRLAGLGMAGIGGLAMLLMMGIVCANIVMRPFGASIRGTVELSGYLCALAVGLCMPAAQLAGSHIAAGLWEEALPRPVRFLLRPLCHVACAALLALTGLELLGIAEYAEMMGETIDGFTFSYYAMTLGCALGILLHSLLFIHMTLSALLPVKGERQ